MVHLSVASLVGQTCGFAMGTALATLLFILVRRFGGTHSHTRLLFAACMLLANGAGLAKNLTLLLRPSTDPALLEHLRAAGFSAAALLPIFLVVLWRNNKASPARRRAGTLLLVYAVASSIAIALALILQTSCHACFSSLLPLSFLSDQDALGNFTFYNGLITLIAAGFVGLPDSLHSRTAKTGFSLMIAGLVFSSLSALLDTYGSLPPLPSALVRVTRLQSSSLVLLGVLLLFSRFRAADVFAKYAIRLLLAAGLSVAASLAIFSIEHSIDQTTVAGRAADIVISAAIIASALISYGALGRWSDLIVGRKIFGRRDTREVIRELRDRLDFFASKDEVLLEMRSAAAEYLGMQADEVFVHPSDSVDHAAPGAASIAIPYEVEPMTLVVSPQTGNQMVLVGELETLSEIAICAGRRLSELDREREKIESARLESRLNEQLAQAELIALRAQVNPHFLFNSLNTITSLIASQPKRAETITLRLANVFRYVLLHADKPFASVEEELGFLRTYLDVEQIRFGSRLQVEFDTESSVAYLAVPSLILQPLVENAIKHGIARKVGNSKIVVRTRRTTSSLLMEIEDNGVGVGLESNGHRAAGNGTSTGFGLRNIRERLQTLYGGRASFSLTGRLNGGTCATLEIPLEE